MSNILKIGWAETDLTPNRNVFIAGQFHARISEGIMDPITSTVLAIESIEDSHSSSHLIMVSCDFVGVSDILRDTIRQRVASKTTQINPENIFLGATHTHSAPVVNMPNDGIEEYLKKQVEGKQLDILYPSEYIDFAADLIVSAILEAWQKREVSGISYGVSHAVIGRNRRLTYTDGKSVMYGKPNVPEFSLVEGYEDHSVYGMMTYNSNKNLTGIIVNIPCPSQVSESSFLLSADYWHETRIELRKRFGERIYILPQCAPAGDQSPHLLLDKRAEERMWRLKGRELDQNPPRTEISKKIGDAMSDIIPYAQKEIDWSPIFKYKREVIQLPRRIISKKDVEEALKESQLLKEKYKQLIEELNKSPDILKKPRWYTQISKTYKLMKWGEKVKERFELQEKSSNIPIEAHFARIGDTAFATNPFELYLDYGIRIKELSKATQTFLIQKAGSAGTYLPSRRSIAGGGYGSLPASTDVGPEGGDKLVEMSVSAINSMFE